MPPATRPTAAPIRLSMWRVARDVRHWTHSGGFAERPAVWAKGVRYLARSASGLLRPRIGQHELSDYEVWLLQRNGDATYRFCRDAEYGKFFADFLRGIDAPFILLDVGANIGLYSLIGLSNPNCRRVVAVEPSPATIDYLRANLEVSGREEWTIVDAAISTSSGWADLHMPPGHSGGATIGDGTESSEATGSSQRVRLIGPSELREVLSDDPIPLVAKVDVEGHEAEVVEAVLSATGCRLSAAWIEFSLRTDHERVREALISAGFVESHRHGLDSHYDALWTRRR